MYRVHKSCARDYEQTHKFLVILHCRSGMCMLCNMVNACCLCNNTLYATHCTMSSYLEDLSQIPIFNLKASK